MRRVLRIPFSSRVCKFLWKTREADRVGPSLCLLLATCAVAWVPVAQAGTKPSPTSPGASRPLQLADSAEAHFWGTVQKVFNATSLVVVTSERTRYDVRLLGIDPPALPRPAGPGVQPTEGQPFGVEAATYLRDLVLDKQVQFETFGKDPSGRTLAVVWLGDLNVNLILVKEGLAWVHPRVPVMWVRAELEVAERQAQVGKYGLWALPNPEPPWEFRKRNHLPVE
jgi:micrococcal nuclease